MHRVGVDIIEIARVADAVAQYGERFLHRVYTNAELEYCQNRVNQLATRFAAKEAIVKALGAGSSGIGWKDMEVVSGDDGAPSIKLHGKAIDRFNDLGLTNLVVSLSHSKDYAVASVVGGTK
jgi:holo-[acyl-carrier protein] synthase